MNTDTPERRAEGLTDNASPALHMQRLNVRSPNQPAPGVQQSPVHSQPIQQGPPPAAVGMASPGAPQNQTALQKLQEERELLRKRQEELARQELQLRTTQQNHVSTMDSTSAEMTTITDPFLGQNTSSDLHTRQGSTDSGLALHMQRLNVRSPNQPAPGVQQSPVHSQPIQQGLPPAAVGMASPGAPQNQTALQKLQDERELLRKRQEELARQELQLRTTQQNHVSTIDSTSAEMTTITDPFLGQNTSSDLHTCQGSTDSGLDKATLERDNTRLRTILKCLRCEDRFANILFFPCTHHRLCEECAADVTMCPVCGRNVEKKVKTYMS